MDERGADSGPQSNEFRREIIQVTDGVYVAVGYSASTVILIQGDAGSIIVDTATDMVAAQQIRDAFGGRLRAPVRAIIYTHSHGDHTGGARVFAGNDNPDIYSHQLFLQAHPSGVKDVPGLCQECSRLFRLRGSSDF